MCIPKIFFNRIHLTLFILISQYSQTKISSIKFTLIDNNQFHYNNAHHIVILLLLAFIVSNMNIDDKREIPGSLLFNLQMSFIVATR